MTRRAIGPGLAGRKILVVEDEYFIADDLRQWLRRAGADVLGPACNAAEARKIIASSAAIDAALIDINLRGALSYPLIDELRHRGIPSALVTGYGHDAVPERYRHVPFWQKPYVPEDLMDDLTHLIHSGGEFTSDSMRED